MKKGSLQDEKNMTVEEQVTAIGSQLNDMNAANYII
jgi:hypothetical protein